MPVIYVIEVVVGIGILILIHEFGHFLFAKLSGVKVEKFSIGFGPEILGFTRGETRYSLRILPLGGFVKMLGDEPGTDEVVDNRSFLAQKFYKKFAIVAAGAVFNIVLALIMFVAVFQIGISFPASVVGVVEYGSPAWFAGVREGDKISAVAGKRDVDFSDIAVTAALADPGKPLNLTVQRAGKEETYAVIPDYSRSLGRGYIGVEPAPSLKIESLVSNEDKPNPLASAGVEPGSTLLAFNAKPLASWDDFERAYNENGLKPFTLSVRAPSGATADCLITPQRGLPFLGVSPVQTTSIKTVDEGSLAEKMGLKRGDTIIALGFVPVSDIFQLDHAINDNLFSLPPLKVKRGGETINVPFPRRPSSGNDFVAGIDVETQMAISYVEPDSPADVIGIRPGDVITKIDGRGVETFESMRETLHAAKGNSISVTWTRHGQVFERSFSPVFLGIMPGTLTVERKLPFLRACRVGFSKAWDFVSQIYLLLRKLGAGQGAVAKNLSGPVSIAHISYRLAERGVTQLLFFLAVIGVNLGIINLLPIPILDGGLLAVFIVEAIRGKPLPAKVQSAIQYVGLALIIALFLFVTWQDIFRLIRGT